MVYAVRSLWSPIPEWDELLGELSWSSVLLVAQNTSQMRRDRGFARVRQHYQRACTVGGGIREFD
jgi:hypothetical protein